MIRSLSFILAAVIAGTACLHAAPRQLSGIYPSLAMFNNEGECGTGAVVPWAGKLWVITYAPHQPTGSSDKLYEISPELVQTIRPESIGGTPANRMIHRESQQLFIGPYAIGAEGNVRTIPYTTMYGRLTGLARHLTDPAGKIVFATMEEGIYEVDVKTLAVTELWADEQRKTGRHADLPGYHGKGFFSAQGRYIYANNGDHAKEALSNPSVPSGVLAEWDGKADKWTVVRRNQFTDVTGPGGIEGGRPGDPVWSVGWDHRSLILMLLDGGKWQTFRLPKASNSYDGAHGWNTEWPRIREVGDGPLLMTMHGMFWDFPRAFSAKNTAGIRPVSSYVKVVGDFCGWKDQIVFGCDDAAKSEFLNKRAAKGKIAAPQSQSNLWFVKRNTLRDLGPYLSQGAVWLGDDVKAGEASDPFLFSNGVTGSLWLSHEGAEPVTVSIQWDEWGKGEWTKWFEVTLPAHGGQALKLYPDDWQPQHDGSWKYDPLYPPDGPPNTVGKGRGRGIGISPIGAPRCPPARGFASAASSPCKRRRRSSPAVPRVISSKQVRTPFSEALPPPQSQTFSPAPCVPAERISGRCTSLPQVATRSTNSTPTSNSHVPTTRRRSLITRRTALSPPVCSRWMLSPSFTPTTRANAGGFPKATPPSTKTPSPAPPVCAVKSAPSAISSMPTAPSTNCPRRMPAALPKSAPSARTTGASTTTAPGAGCSSCPASPPMRPQATASSAATTEKPRSGPVPWTTSGSWVRPAAPAAHGRTRR